MVAMQKILVAYDGSDPAKQAFEIGLDLAHKYNASLTVLSVATPPDPPELVDTKAVLENAKEYYDKQFSKLRNQAKDQPVKVDFAVKVGHPAEQIIRFAGDNAVDLIVMGHRGRSMMVSWLLGSISKRVLSYAPCGVYIVR